MSDLVLVPKALPKAMETKKNLCYSSIALCGDTLGYEVVVDWEIVEISREFSVGRETEMSCSGLMVQYTTQ